jgi:hypothetical protein
MFHNVFANYSTAEAEKRHRGHRERTAPSDQQLRRPSVAFLNRQAGKSFEQNLITI